MTLVRQRGVFGRVLLISVFIRLGKYLGLYLLVLGLAGQWGPQVVQTLSFGVVLVALILSEAVASTPLSGFAGFGAYELLMMNTLTLAGLSQSQATLLPVALHFITQSVDYSLGSLALFVLSLRRRSPENAP